MGDGAESVREVAVRCRCGSLRGALHLGARGENMRIVCYCDDCQAFARFLGNAHELLDANGGSDIVHLSPARLRIGTGAEQLACVRMTAKGPYRWYARCCRTPIGNTLGTPQIPFLGLLAACVDTEGRDRDEVLGPVALRIMAKFATGALPTRDANSGFSLPHIAQAMFRIFCWRLRGDQRHTPFFDTATGRPVAVPEIVSSSSGA